MTWGRDVAPGGLQWRPDVETARVEREAAPLATEMLGLLANHGVPLTDELRTAARQLAFTAILARGRQ